MTHCADAKRFEHPAGEISVNYVLLCDIEFKEMCIDESQLIQSICDTAVFCDSCIDKRVFVERILICTSSNGFGINNGIL